MSNETNNGQNAGQEIENYGTYDYIIVGAGSSGCAVTRRLIDGSDARILLLEAGGSNEAEENTINTLLWPLNKNSSIDYAYKYEPTPFADNKIIPLPAGKVVGGGGSINVMVWARGNRYDYDKWAEAGNKGWDYNSVLPLFKKIEDWEDGETEFHGKGGPMRIERAPLHPLSTVMIESGKTYGMPYLEDTNAENPVGVGIGVMNATKGRRHGPATGYLQPVINNEQLELLTQARVLKLNVENGACNSLTFEKDGKVFTADASAGVILCAGAIATPKLLLLSGIGDTKELEEAGVTPVHHLPGVGKNLQDHLILESMIFQAHESLMPFSGNYTGNTAYWKTNPALKAADLMIFATQVPVGTPHISEKYGPFGDNAFCFLPALVNIKSRGYVQLRDNNPDTPLKIQGNLLTEEQDIDAMVRAVEICMDLAEQPAFSKYIKKWVAPAKRLTTREEIIDFLKDAVTSYIHPVGTCKMGSGADAVVSDKLLVHGIKGLRIADASIMPEVTSSNTQAPTLMIAEFAAQLILAERKEPVLA